MTDKEPDRFEIFADANRKRRARRAADSAAPVPTVRPLRDEVKKQIRDDYLRGWSQESIARAHQIGRKRVRTVLKDSPTRSLDDSYHYNNLSYRRERLTEQSRAAATRSPGKSLAELRRAKAENAKLGLRARYDPSLTRVFERYEEGERRSRAEPEYEAPRTGNVFPQDNAQGRLFA